MEAVDATTEEARIAALDRHVAAVRAHVKTLAARDYSSAVPGDVDLVILFLPGDPYLGAAFERDPDLQVEALRARVLVATPTTLLALLRTVAIYWQQKSLAENAERIAEVARELYDRTVTFGEHLSKVGKGLEDAVEAYNKASGSFTRRLLPMRRQLEEMRVAEHLPQLLDAPQPVEIAPRDLGDRVQAEDDRVGRLF
jgi:DNA recombination protein RmuC